MKKQNYLVALAMGVSTTALLGQVASAGTTSVPKSGENVVADKTNEVFSKSEHCAEPTSRDYSDVLAAYTADHSDGYKFSGCGGVI